ncbi:MAG: malonyl-ACP O-methyltransferase BioC [Deltaproteobacteria bacterium]|nr:malonyl-ACP O-methyltransferase BioC [Deltaproteobacteria bacterium]
MEERRKKAIIRRFSKAAATYDEYALVQKESAAELAAKLPEKFVAASILEIGCGTGNYTAMLAERFPRARITALDFAESMVAQARVKCSLPGGITFLCADGEDFLRTNRQQFDLITSNATMQWFAAPGAAFCQAARSLAPGGIFLVSLFGPATLHELGEGLAEVVAESIALPAGQFPDGREIARLAGLCFSRVEVAERVYKRRYPSLRDLFRHIRKTGTGGYHPHLPLLTRSRQQRLEQWFLGRGGYEVTYQVFFVVASATPARAGA